MEIDDILAGVDTVMTEGLMRLFKSAGCSPTVCHACGKPIKVGDTFKLVTHTKKEAGATATDEMCCNKCGIKELENRYTRVPWKPDLEERGRYSKPTPKPFVMDRHGNAGIAGGYSRPSKLA